MLDQSMLARDRRRETWLVVAVLLLLTFEVLVGVLELNQIFPFLGWGLLLLNQVMAGIGCGLIFVWTFLRLFRLRSLRRNLFLFGLFVWVALFGVAVASQLAIGFGYPWIIPISPIVVFMILMAFVSLLSKWRLGKTVAEFGWPVFKAVHWFLLTIIGVLGSLHFLSVWQLIAFSAFGVYIVSRYSYNRWIYATSVTYPFKKTASKFYVKQMSRPIRSKSQLNINSGGASL